LISPRGPTSIILKLLYVLIDGVGDRPDQALQGRTPLEAARTPALDAIAKRGISGLVYTVGKGIAPESDVAVFSMLGYSFGDDYPGRGVVEAVGAKTGFRDGDLALRANFATVDAEMNITDRRAGRDLGQAEGKMLAREIVERVRLSVPGASFTFVHTLSHRAVLSFRVAGEALSGEVSNTDPAYSRVGGMGVAKEKITEMRPLRCEALDSSRGAILGASLVNEFVEKSHDLLDASGLNKERVRRGSKPANMILTRDAGSKLPSVQKLADRFGVSFAAVADMPVELGIGTITGMDVFVSKGVSDYGDKLSKVRDLLGRYDVVYLHIKGPDEPGHDGDALGKVRSLEDIDAGFFTPLMGSAQMEGVTIAVSADHSTPCSMKAHSDDPVPLVISRAGMKGDGTMRFTEREAAKGSLGTLAGKDVLALSLKYAR
jgi:2,3-bisphosphoglycerate-independent phosphoglycerate mutase